MEEFREITLVDKIIRETGAPSDGKIQSCQTYI